MADARCIRCGRVIPDSEQLCLHCGDYDDQQRFCPPKHARQTNGDRIRAMSNAELVKLLMGSYPCDSRHGCPDDCENCIREWLESEANSP